MARILWNPFWRIEYKIHVRRRNEKKALAISRRQSTEEKERKVNHGIRA